MRCCCAAPARTPAGHHHHPDRFGAGARAVGRRASTTSTCPTTCRARCRGSSPFPPAHRPGLETELWPNLLFGCRDHGIPSRSSSTAACPAFAAGYGLLEACRARCAACAGRVAQSAADAARFLRSGRIAETTVVGGNLKFDIAAVDPTGAIVFARVPRASRQRADWIAASTHAGRGAAGARLTAHAPALAHCCCCGRRGIRSASARSRTRPCRRGGAPRREQMTHQPDAADDVFVVDTLGELARFYACAGRGLRRRQPQDIGGTTCSERGRRHRDGHRPAPAQFRRHRRAARGGGRVAHRRRPCRGGRCALEALFADEDASARERWPRRRSDCRKRGRGALAAHMALDCVADAMAPAAAASSDVRAGYGLAFAHRRIDGEQAVHVLVVRRACPRPVPAAAGSAGSCIWPAHRPVAH